MSLLLLLNNNQGQLRLQASPGGYNVSGASASLLKGYVLKAAAGSYVVTGASAAFAAAHAIKASAGSYTITGDSATLLRGHVLGASPGTYSITGASARLLWDHALAAALGTYTITGFAANFVVPGHFVLSALPGSYAITGASASFVKSTSVKVEIDAVLSKKQLEALRKRLAAERGRRKRDFEREAETRKSLRTALESFFKVAEPEQVEEIKEQLPVKAEEGRQRPTKADNSQKISARIDWPKLYDDRALMDGLTRDLSKILADHARMRFEQEEDDLALMLIL